MEEVVPLRLTGAARHVSGVGYRSRDVAPADHRGLPSPWLTVVVALDEKLHVAAHPDPHQPGGTYDALVGGLHTRPAIIRHDGRQSGVQLSVSPLAARALLGQPAGELAGLDVHAGDVLGREVSLLRERLLATDGWKARRAVLDDAVRRWLRDVEGPPPEVVRAWQVLLARRGEVRIADLAADVGWSARHLGVRFRQEVGLSPSEARRVVRFSAARRLLQRTRGTVGLADVAAQTGFYDQAHLAREFRELAGVPPSRWMREERIASVQDPDRTAGSR